MRSTNLTLKMDLPAEFNVYATAHYNPLFSGVCFKDFAGDPNFDKKRFSSRSYSTPNTSDFELGLTYKVADCLMALSGIDFRVIGQPGTNKKEFGISSVELGVQTFMSEGDAPVPPLAEQAFSVRCRWKGPISSNTSEQKLECHGLDIKGQELEGSWLGMLEIIPLQGASLRLRGRVADSSQMP